MKQQWPHTNKADICHLVQHMTTQCESAPHPLLLEASIGLQSKMGPKSIPVPSASPVDQTGEQRPTIWRVSQPSLCAERTKEQIYQKKSCQDPAMYNFRHFETAGQ